jgi:WhiB family redox-sensing transcriptional regulator
MTDLAPWFIRELKSSFRMGDWVRDAACTPDTANLFHPEAGQHGENAKLICSGCPVIDQCRDYAINNPETLTGIWGGQSAIERRKERASRGIKVRKDHCGTAAGYRQHYRDREVPCAACRREAAKERAERRKAAK